MASGRKDYFRHSFFAVEDEKIQHIIDEMGFEGYGYYFSLLEILGRRCAEEIVNPIIIHEQTLRSLWRKQKKSCQRVVEKLEESGLFVATFRKSFVEFDIPNLSKYLGRYENKNAPKTTKERKEKKSKENKTKAKNNAVAKADDVAVSRANKIGEVWNTYVGMLDGAPLAKIKLPVSADRIQKILPALGEFDKLEDWTAIIGQIGCSPFNLGQNDRNWKANFDWLFHPTKFNYRKLWEESSAEDSHCEDIPK